MNTLKLLRSYLASLMLTNALHVLMQQETVRGNREYQTRTRNLSLEDAG
jgi:hypothetical protein